MEETISLKELFQTLKKRMSLIVIITSLAVIASGIFSYFFLTPIYQVSTQILVNQSKDEQSLYNSSEVQTNLQLINTYNVIIKSPAILEKVNNELKLGTSVVDLIDNITVESEANSQVVNVMVQDEDPVRAAKIANKTVEVFQREIKTIMNVDNVSILAQAEAVDNQTPVKPQPLLNIVIALVVGLMVGIGLAFLLEYLDNTLKTEQDIEKVLDLPVLGSITRISDSAFKESSSRTSARKTRVRGESVGS